MLGHTGSAAKTTKASPPPGRILSSEKRQAGGEHRVATDLRDPEAIDENPLQNLAAAHRCEAS